MLSIMKKFKIGDHVRISKYKNIFLRDILLIGVKKTNQKEFRIEKVIKRKGYCMSNGKDMITLLIVGLMKKFL